MKFLLTFFLPLEGSSSELSRLGSSLCSSSLMRLPYSLSNSMPSRFSSAYFCRTRCAAVIGLDPDPKTFSTPLTSATACQLAFFMQYTTPSYSDGSSKSHDFVNQDFYSKFHSKFFPFSCSLEKNTAHIRRYSGKMACDTPFAS